MGWIYLSKDRAVVIALKNIRVPYNASPKGLSSVHLIRN